MPYLLCASVYVGAALQAKIEKVSYFNHWIERGRSFCRHTAFLISFLCLLICSSVTICLSKPEKHIF